MRARRVEASRPAFSHHDQTNQNADKKSEQESTRGGILGLFPVTFSVFVFILLRFDSQSSLSMVNRARVENVEMLPENCRKFVGFFI